MNSPESPPKPGPDLSLLRMDRDDEPPPRRRGWLVVIALLGLVALSVYFLRHRLPFLLAKVDTTVVTRVTQAEASTVLTATGYTYARTRAAVGSKIIGRITDLRVDEGDRVRKGEIIAVLDSDDLRAAQRRTQAGLQEAEARLADAARESRRRQRLFEAGIGPESDADASATALAIAEAQVATVNADLDSIGAQLDYTVLRSPIDGVVIERNVEVGEMVAPGGFTSQQSTGAVVRLADPTSLEIEADINESYIARLEIGQPASISVDAVPGFQYTGSLRQIVPTADRQRAVVEVKVSIDDRDDRLVPDMSCSVTFLEEGTDRAQLAAAEPTIAVDRRALQVDGANTFVWRVDDGVLSRTAVDVQMQAAGDAATTDGSVEVVKGLSGGEVVVIDPAADLEDGQRVRVSS